MRADWISPWWQAACLPDRWDVCGFDLPSLSVWHVFALEQLGNHYLCGGPRDKDDVANLILFAGGDMDQGRRLMLSQAHRSRQVIQAYRRLRGQPFSELDAACLDYVESCTRTPSRYESKDAKPCAAPYQWHILRAVCENYNLTPDHVWNMPYAMAKCYYDVAAEHNGDTKILSVRAQEMEDNWPDYNKEATPCPAP